MPPRCASSAVSPYSTDPSAIAKPNARLIKLLIRAHRFHATLIGSPGLPFCGIARRREPVLFRLVRLNYLVPAALASRDRRCPMTSAALRYWNIARQR